MSLLATTEMGPVWLERRVKQERRGHFHFRSLKKRHQHSAAHISKVTKYYDCSSFLLRLFQFHLIFIGCFFFPATAFRRCHSRSFTSISPCPPYPPLSLHPWNLPSSSTFITLCPVFPPSLLCTCPNVSAWTAAPMDSFLMLLTPNEHLSILSLPSWCKSLIDTCFSLSNSVLLLMTLISLLCRLQTSYSCMTSSEGLEADAGVIQQLHTSPLCRYPRGCPAPSSHTSLLLTSSCSTTFTLLAQS